MRALRSLAFGLAVLLTMLLLLVTNIGMWAFSGLLDPPALARAVTTSLADRDLRARISREVADGVAGAVIDLGPLPGPVRHVLDLPARPSHAALSRELATRIDGLLADEATSGAVVLATAAFSQVIGGILEGRSDEDPGRDGLEVDLTPLGRLVLDRIDPSGGLAGALPSGAGRIRLVDSTVVTLAMPLVRLVHDLRWMLPLACLVAVAVILVLARFRVHALAWVGLCAVVAGTVSLLVASGGPVLIPRAAGLDPADTAALTSVLDALTADLVTQSAVLAGLGLALVVAGIAGGVVVSHGDTSGRDLQHEWDSSRLS